MKTRVGKHVVADFTGGRGCNALRDGRWLVCGDLCLQYTIHDAFTPTPNIRIMRLNEHMHMYFAEHCIYIDIIPIWYENFAL